MLQRRIRYICIYIRRAAWYSRRAETSDEIRSSPLDTELHVFAIPRCCLLRAVPAFNRSVSKRGKAHNSRLECTTGLPLLNII